MPGEPIIEAADFFLLRTPALPRSLQKTLRAEYDRGVAPSRSALLRDPLVREALFLASSNLSARLDRQDAGADARLDLAAARYLYRMLARPTPYGMFAGVTLGRSGDAFDLRVCDSEQAARVCRIDQSVISDLQLELCGEGAIEYLRGTSLILNDSLWKAPDGFRYVELGARRRRHAVQAVAHARHRPRSSGSWTGSPQAPSPLPICRGSWRRLSALRTMRPRASSSSWSASRCS